ncbi:ATP phosphoribosyltransferase [Erysiphe neolycopersici]|uniref:ATP phosphoribosyltransferase n=1 Tax=Erysiphe neolycopersici TaxID=212602 RepID=A0A420HKC5_9PEZI|nr:ATP phosphoribosyltransferase [Erysiphe neolycopersici]
MDIVNHLEGRLLFAVPKSELKQSFREQFLFWKKKSFTLIFEEGRLLQATLDLLNGADIIFKREHRQDIALCKNLPIALVFLPASDIPTFVGEGRVSLGITGRDTVAEYMSSVDKNERKHAGSHKSNVESEAIETKSGCREIMDLNFGFCKLQVQVPENGIYKQPSDLIGKNIGTSFVNLTKDYFSRIENDAKHLTEKRVNVETANASLCTNVIELSGSVEAACALGVADGIVDLVESGETMKAAGLQAIDTVMESTAILIQNFHSSDQQIIDLIISRLQGIIAAQKYVLCQYNIARTNLKAALKITPGKRAATISPLEDEDWVAVNAMVEKKIIASSMDRLCEIGAEDIFVIKIQNSR